MGKPRLWMGKPGGKETEKLRIRGGGGQRRKKVNCMGQSIRILIVRPSCLKMYSYKDVASPRFFIGHKLIIDPGF